MERFAGPDNWSKIFYRQDSTGKNIPDKFGKCINLLSGAVVLLISVK